MIPSGSTFRPGIPWMNEAERTLFKKMREDGTLSYFRTAACRMCKAEILKGKTFCSKRHMIAFQKLKASLRKLLDDKRKG